MLQNIDTIVDQFVSCLADGVFLSIETSDPIIDRFVNACLSDDVGKWITIGGKQKGDEKHHGGFRVQIDGRGNIVKGRMKGTNVKDVKAKFDEKKDVGRPLREKEEHSKMPSFMRNGERKQNIPRNTIDSSRNDGKISPVEQQTSGDKGEKMNKYYGWREDNDEFEMSEQEAKMWAEMRQKAGSDYAKKVENAVSEKVVDMPREPGWNRDMTNDELQQSLNNKRRHGKTPSGISYLVINGPGERVTYRIRQDGRWDYLGKEYF